MTSMRVGVQVQPQHADFEGMRRAWREAEALGVDSIFCWDHFFPLSGEPDGKHFGIHGDLMGNADSLAEAGVQHLIVGVGGDGSGYDLSVVRELVAWRDQLG